MAFIFTHKADMVVLIWCIPLKLIALNKYVERIWVAQTFRGKISLLGSFFDDWIYY